jgi:superfamily II DNA/RNA helicase
MSDKARKESLDAYNQGKLRVVLVGPAGAEGISLKGTRLLQVLDPHWHESRTSQAVGRGVRLDSHTHLPEVDRNVSVIKYVSRPQQGLIRRLLGLKNKTVGADTFLSTRAAEKQEQLDVFNDLLKEVGQNR